MFNKFSVVSAIILCVSVMVSCRQNSTAETGDLPVTMDDSSRVIIDRAIAYAGGYDPWQQKKTLSFDIKKHHL